LQAVDVARLIRAGVEDFVVQHRFAHLSDAVTAFAQMRAGLDDGAVASA